VTADGEEWEEIETGRGVGGRESVETAGDGRETFWTSGDESEGIDEDNVVHED